MQNSIKYCTFLIVFTLTGIKLNAQALSDDTLKGSDELITDRPDQTESSSVVPLGTLQVETGAFLEKVKNQNIENVSKMFNTTLFRYGLLDRLELRLGFDILEQSQSVNGLNSTVANGFSPLMVGAKVAITEEKGLLPEIALLGHLSLPFSASKDYHTENTAVDFRFAFSHTLTENSSIGYNLGAAWGDDLPQAVYVYSVAYGHGITDKIGAYAELYGDIREHAVAGHLWNIGLTYLIKNNVQLDVSGGTGISPNIQDLLLSGGISFRIPN